MNRDEKLAYARGYQAGIRGKWPMHLPSIPMADSVVRALLVAGSNLRQQADGLLATFDKGDCPELDAAIDEFDDAVKAFNEKLLTLPQKGDS